EHQRAKSLQLVETFGSEVLAPDDDAVFGGFECARPLGARSRAAVLEHRLDVLLNASQAPPFHERAIHRRLRALRGLLRPLLLVVLVEPHQLDGAEQVEPAALTPAIVPAGAD